MSWGSKQNYEVTRIKSFLNPPNEYQISFYAVWLGLADLIGLCY